MINREKFFWFSTLLVFAITISVPFFSTERLVYGHDALFHAARIEGMAASLEGGQFPVRIVGKSLAGFGDCSGIFYPNFFLYIPALLRLLGAPLVVAYNALGILINFATIFLSFWSFNRLFGSIKTAAVCSMIFGGFLYRLIDLCARSAFGEALAMAFLPTALISFWLMLNRSEKMWGAVVLSFTAVLQSHILSSLLMLGAAILISIASFDRLKRAEVLRSIAKAAAFTFALNLWFYLPLVELFDQIHFQIRDLAAVEHQLSAGAFDPGFFVSMQLFCGWAIVALLIAYVVKVKRPNREWLILVSIGLLTLLASTELFPWRAIENIFGSSIGIFQYPFRLLTLGSIALSICAGISLVELIKSDRLAILCCFFIALANIFFLNRVENLQSTPVKDIYWTLRYDQTDFNKKFYFAGYFGELDYVYDDLDRCDLERLDSSAENWVVSDLRKKGMTIEFTARTRETSTIRLPLIYYPGYEARSADGQELIVRELNRHRLAVEVPGGATRVKVEYVGFRSWRLAELLSLASLIAFFVQRRREA